MFDSEYTVVAGHNATGLDVPIRVRGMRVGHLAVRFCPDPFEVDNVGGSTRPCRPYVVDHVPSRWLLADFTRFVDAMRFADDASRHAGDLASSKPDDVIAALGPLQGPWVNACIANDYAIPYREFCAWASVRGIMSTPADGLVASVLSTLSRKALSGAERAAELDRLAQAHGVRLVLRIVAELGELWEATNANAHLWARGIDYLSRHAYDLDRSPL